MEYRFSAAGWQSHGAPQALPAWPGWRPRDTARCHLAGIGQIYFEPSALFGLVLLASLYLAHPLSALGCVLGVVSATLTSRLAGLDANARADGLHGYNGALAGAGLGALYAWNSALAAAMLLAGVLAPLLANWLAGVLSARGTGPARHAGLPVLTAPFVLIMWLAMGAARLSAWAGFDAGLVSASMSTPTTLVPAPLACVFGGIGQVSFVGAVPLGAALWFTLARTQWRSACWMLAGAALAWLALISGMRIWPAAGIGAQATGMGVNGALAALALSVVGGCGWAWRLAGAALSILCSLLFGLAGLAYFTLPFVLAVWLILWLRAQSGKQRMRATQTSAT